MKNAFLIRVVNKFLSFFNYSIYNKKDFTILSLNGLTYKNDLLYTYHNADFMDDPKFVESYNLGKATDFDLLLKNYDIQWRIHVLCWAARHAELLEGDFVDCGVSTGIFAKAVINYIDFNRTKKKYYLFDTFTGMDARYSSADEMRSSHSLGYDKEDKYEKVKETFKGYNCEIIKGPIPETLTRCNIDKVSYLSIDMNSVIPESEALNFFWDKMVPGGLIILDDHGYSNTTIEQRKAHKAFAKSKNIEILSLPTCQGLIIKPN